MIFWYEIKEGILGSNIHYNSNWRIVHARDRIFVKQLIDKLLLVLLWIHIVRATIAQRYVVCIRSHMLADASWGSGVTDLSRTFQFELAFFVLMCGHAPQRRFSAVHREIRIELDVRSGTAQGSRKVLPSQVLSVAIITAGTRIVVMNQTIIFNVLSLHREAEPRNTRHC